MAGGAGRAALVGAGIAVLLVAAAALGYWAWLSAEQETRQVTEVLVICTTPDEDGGEVAAMAFRADLASGSTIPLDTLEPASVPGTSARTARDAFPYGGGPVVARALAGGSGTEVPEWIVVPWPVWSKVADDAGGLELDVPSGLSAYSAGKLTLIEPGRRTLTGAELVAVAASSEYLSEEDAADSLTAITRGIAGFLTAKPGLLADLVASGRAASSVESQRIGRTER